MKLFGAPSGFVNASLAAIPPLQGRVKASYLTCEKRLTAASIPYAAKETPPFKEEFFNFVRHLFRPYWPFDPARRICLSLFLLAAPLMAQTPNKILYGNLPESCPPPFRMFAMGDYLYWQASEDQLEYSMKQRGVSGMNAQASSMAIDYPYKNGIRLGGGLVFPDYDWQVAIDWTRFYHNLHDCQTHEFAGNPGLIALWMHPAGHGYLTWENANLSWDLKLDLLDFDLLRVGFVNRNFSLTPRIGLSRGWIKQAFHVRYEQSYDSTSGLLPAAYYDVRLNNDFRCIGPRIGFDTQLLAGWGFNLAASATGSLLYGHYNLHRIDVSSSYASVDLLERIYRFKPAAFGRIALEWSRCMMENSCRLLLSIGYEGQVWWGQNQLRSFVSRSLPPSNFRTNGALTLKGLDFHARFDF